MQFLGLALQVIPHEECPVVGLELSLEFLARRHEDLAIPVAQYIGDARCLLVQRVAHFDFVGIRHVSDQIAQPVRGFLSAHRSLLRRHQLDDRDHAVAPGASVPTLDQFAGSPRVAAGLDLGNQLALGRLKVVQDLQRAAVGIAAWHLRLQVDLGALYLGHEGEFHPAAAEQADADDECRYEDAGREVSMLQGQQQAAAIDVVREPDQTLLQSLLPKPQSADILPVLEIAQVGGKDEKGLYH